jgi:hypothetical protein
MRAIFFLAAGGMTILAGCASPRQRHPPEAAASGPQRVGTVAVVNEELHFVLVDVGSLYVPQAGTALKSFSGMAETGILAVDPEKQRPFIVADIVKGSPKVGDEVRE